MERSPMPTPSAALSLLLALASAVQDPPTPPAPAASAYDMQRWAAPGRCEPTPGDSPQAGDAGLAARTARFLAALDAGIEQGAQALRLDQLCKRITDEFFPGLLPPARPEPWNPDPPQPQGQVFQASIRYPGTPSYTQHIDVTYTPANLTLSLSTTVDDPDRDQAGERGYLYQDMGPACPLRLAALSRHLRGRGFSERRYGLVPPDAAAAHDDSGVRVGFEHAGQSVEVELQGRFEDQRRDPDNACVERIGFTVSPG
jgi:hypothetical protein